MVVTRNRKTQTDVISLCLHAFSRLTHTHTHTHSVNTFLTSGPKNSISGGILDSTFIPLASVMIFFNTPTIQLKPAHTHTHTYTHIMFQACCRFKNCSFTLHFKFWSDRNILNETKHYLYLNYREMWNQSCKHKNAVVSGFNISLKVTVW